MQAIVSVINRIWDILINLWNIFATIFDFVWNLLGFIISAVATLIKYIGRAFSTIFTDWFFNTIHVWLWQLEVYLGTAWTNILIVFLVLVFAFIVFGFIMRLMKWQLHYYNTEKKLKKFE